MVFTELSLKLLILRAMFFITKHVDKENSEYPANADYPVLKNKKEIGKPSIYAESVI